MHAAPVDSNALRCDGFRYSAHLTDDPTMPAMSLEATFRHMYFEETTHLYNIQRLKRAQGLATVVEVPRVGY